jgi:Flp pilus assembly pilin Flp
MTEVMSSMWRLKIWKDTRGQDFLEYALIAAFIVVAYAAFSPQVAPAVAAVFTKVNGSLIQAGSN